MNTIINVIDEIVEKIGIKRRSFLIFQESEKAFKKRLAKAIEKRIRLDAFIQDCKFVIDTIRLLSLEK